MKSENENATASGIIQHSLQAVKQSFNRLLTELREAGQKTEAWPKVEPIINRVDAAMTNFFTKPEVGTVQEIKSSIGRGWAELREVCQHSPQLSAGLLPFVAGAEALSTTFLQQYQEHTH